jgi:hypothetical protein
MTQRPFQGDFPLTQASVLESVLIVSHSRPSWWSERGTVQFTLQDVHYSAACLSDHVGEYPFHVFEVDDAAKKECQNHGYADGHDDEIRTRLS